MNLVWSVVFLLGILKTAESLRCYYCLTGFMNCDESYPGEVVGCSPNADSCFISYAATTGNWMKGCLEENNNTLGCTHNQAADYCTCDTDLCNQDFATADSGIKCYQCNGAFEDCSENESGSIESCEEGEDACLVSYEHEPDGTVTWNRGCIGLAGSHMHCFQHGNAKQGDGEICFCDENGCNENILTAGKYSLQCYECNGEIEECSLEEPGELKKFNFLMEAACYISVGQNETYTRGALPLIGIEPGCLLDETGVICFCTSDGCNQDPE